MEISQHQKPQGSLQILHFDAFESYLRQRVSLPAVVFEDLGKRKDLKQ